MVIDMKESGRMVRRMVMGFFGLNWGGIIFENIRENGRKINME